MNVAKGLINEHINNYVYKSKLKGLTSEESAVLRELYAIKRELARIIEGDSE